MPEVTATSLELVVGATRISYVVRHSERSRRKQIVVTPDGVEVVVPAGSSAADINRFVHDKRRWVFLTVSDMATATTPPPSGGCCARWCPMRVVVTKR